MITFLLRQSLASLFFIPFLFFATLHTSAQTLTYGTVVNEPEADQGYTLFTPIGHLKTYLIDPCGRLVNSWSSTYPPALTAYLHTDGSLYRAGRIANQSMNITGMGGRIERFDWEGNLTWGYDYYGPVFAPHHDFCVLPNGNVILIVSQKKTRDEAIQAGRDSVAFPASNSALLTEYLVELEPIGADSARIVWEWHVWDHLIQDVDPSKPNYGNPLQHPERIDINFTDFNDLQDFLHMNSVRYNPELDQLLVSNRHISEVWIIDHSTTTEEAASSQGGNSGRGGDLLFRWGNPESTGAGLPSNQYFSSQHNAGWINSHRFLVYNNSPNRGYSSVDQVELQRDSAGHYLQSAGYFLPAQPADTLSLAVNLSAGRLSSAQVLDNGHILVCSGVQGYFTEIDSQHQIIWQYRSPVSPNGIVAQGTTNANSLFSTFNCSRYNQAFSGFAGKDLTPSDPLELNFDLSGCPATQIRTVSGNGKSVIYPNPSSGEVFIDFPEKIFRLEVFDMSGRRVADYNGEQGFSGEGLNPGWYYIQINGHFVSKWVKE